MAELPPHVNAGIETMAKWAARQPEPAKAGGEVAYMLSVAARIRRDGTAEQKAEARKIAEDWRANSTGVDFAALSQRWLDLMGWES